MPIVLKSSEEARKHLAESSKEVAAKLGTLTKSLSSKEANLGHTIGVVGKSLDDLHTSASQHGPLWTSWERTAC